MINQHNSILFLRQPKLVLSVFGIWMLPHRGLPYKFYTSCIVAIHASFMACNLIHMMVVWGDVDQMSEGSYLLFTHVSTCTKFANFVLRKNTFRQLLEAMDARMFASHSKEHDAIMSKHSNRVKKIYLVLVVSSLSNCVLWGLIPQLDKTQKRLPFNVWIPGDTQKSPIYELGYVSQMLMICNATQTFLGLDVVFVALILFMCAQLEMIMVNTQKIQEVTLYGLSRSKNNKLIKRNIQTLSECIRHHQAITSFLKQVKNMFHIPIFIQMSGSILIVCVIGFRISIEPPNTVHFYSTLNYLFLMLAQLFLYCWSGNELTTRSEQLRDWMYFCHWDGNSKKFGRTLIIAMECMRRPVVFNAGHYIPLSRPTFVSILRCSYSYFAVLNQAQGKQ